jgi:hypothetical protein
MSSVENNASPSSSSSPNASSSMLSPLYRNLHLIAEVIVFSVTTIYFYRRIHSLTTQLRDMETKIQQLEKTVNEQKVFINDKMTEMSTIVTSQINNMLKQQQVMRPQFMSPQAPPQPQPQQFMAQPQVAAQPQTQFMQAPPQVVAQPQFMSPQPPQVVQAPPPPQFTQPQAQMVAQPQVQPQAQMVAQPQVQPQHHAQPQVQAQVAQAQMTQQSLPSAYVSQIEPQMSFESVVVITDFTPPKQKSKATIEIEEEYNETDLDKELTDEYQELNS